MRLSTRRGGTGYGPAPISWSDIAAFQRVAGVRLAPWEVEIIEMIDAIFLAQVDKNFSAAKG